MNPMHKPPCGLPSRLWGHIWLLASCMLATCIASVAHADEPRPLAPATGLPPVHFHREVMPALTKAGCNMGACHGSFQGRGGLRLSLLGFDPAADYDSLVKEARGRRINLSAPEQSLILRKPTNLAPHGGGRRWEPTDAGYQLVRRWIEQGAVLSTTDTSIAAIDVTPTTLPLAPGAEARLQVQARWPDGSVRDVTEWALFESREERVATVGPQGQVGSTGPGRTAIVLRYQGHVRAIPVTTPFPTPAAPQEPSEHFIDQLVQAEWKELGLSPSPVVDDATFVRRVYLDLIGTLPTIAERERFLRAAESDKRERLIDELLARPEYVDYWSQKWGDLLRLHRRALGVKGLASVQGWLRHSLRENVGADVMVRDLLTSQGNLYASGPVAFFFIDKTPEELAETAAQVFLGVRLQCAKCHHHPFEVWSQDDYYGLAAFFAPVERKDTREDGAYGGAQSIRLGTLRSVKHPGAGRDVFPAVLGWQPTPEELQPDPRRVLAAWITGPENPWFAKNIANRYWGYLLGRGLIDPLDDLSAANPAVMPRVLDALSRDFAAQGFDRKHLLRTICRSRVYQRAVELTPERDHNGAFFTHRNPRRLPAEVLLDAVNQVTGASETFKDLPAGTRAIALADSAVDSYFLDAFGRTKRTTSCECERMTQPDLGQVLRLANSQFLHDKLAHPQGRLAKLIEAGRTDEEIVSECYLAALGRLPTEEQRRLALELIGQAPARREGLEDMLWALLNSAEFCFQH